MTTVLHPVGIEYLMLITKLLQQLRIDHPSGNFCEAADLQWWWRKDQHKDEKGQTFWLDGDVPVAALIFTNWGEYWGCDMVFDPRRIDIGNLVLAQLEQQLSLFNDKPIEISLYNEDVIIDKVISLGFNPTDDKYVENWMSLEQLPAVSPLMAGFRCVSRSDVLRSPHHMIKRNGEHIVARLSECSLYNPHLDFAIYSDDGEIAAYGLFWADPVTYVGLVEPMRTEDKYQRRGLGKHLLTVGLNTLATVGCSRFKVTNEYGYEAAMKLYQGIGFVPAAEFRVYRKGSFPTTLMTQ